MVAVAAGTTELDRTQLEVVDAPLDARQLVTAAPGCGKTHVACSRVASFLRRGIAPDRLVLLSFTRTAVHEIRQRIAALATGKGSSLAGIIEVRTIDSFAWRLLDRLSARQMQDHETSIQRATASVHRALRGLDPELFEYLRTIDHLVVDEAQDLVGPRADLVLALLGALAPEAGWTVLMDPAQAIYGWSSDGGDEAGQARFIDRLDDLGPCLRRKLVEVHRTSTVGILQVMQKARAVIESASPGAKLPDLERVIEGFATPGEFRASGTPGLVQRLGKEANSTLILHRRRVDALMAASYLRQEQKEKEISFRLRLGGLPRSVVPWIAVVARRMAESAPRAAAFTRAQFEDAWAATCEGRWISRGWATGAAWDLLRKLGRTGADRVDLRDAASSLALSSCPEEAVSRELGDEGPIIGTVHASKGREAASVVAIVPAATRSPETDTQSDEEARVLYVAITRGRERLEILRGTTVPCSYSGDRAWRSIRGAVSIEIGRDGDIDGVWPMCMNHGEDARLVQENLSRFGGRPTTVLMRRIAGTARLETDDGSLIGALSKACVSELTEILTLAAGRKRWPNFAAHLAWMDIATVAVGDDPGLTERLTAPWSELRMWLAPVVLGLGYFKNPSERR